MIKTFKYLLPALFTGLFFIIFITNGCKKNDITLITNSPLGNREKTIGTAFNGCNLFLSKSWSWVEDKNNNHLVVFTGEISKEKLLNDISADSINWLSVEKQYFATVTKSVNYAYIRISFPIADDNSFSINSMNLGLSTGKNTAWSDSFTKEEQEKVIDEIYKNSFEIFKIIRHYADPSVKEGSSLYLSLTGFDIRSL